MLKMIRCEEGRCAPVLDCDICGDRIEDAAQAAVVFSGTNCQIGQKIDLLVVHKGNCHDIAERRSSTTEEGIAGWMELSFFLARLLYNSRISLGKVSDLYGDIEKLEEL